MAIIKYLEFGGIDPNTGEKRVQLLDNSLIKTASNEIQEYWRDLVRKPDCFYLHVIAMSAGEYWGPNKRSDWYGEENLKKYHHQFVTQAKVYKHHINKPDSPSYGRVLYSFYNDNMHRVELILEVDKENAQEYVDKINKGEDIYVSMGMRVPKDECSVCGNIATKLDEYCIHGKTMKNQILDNNEQVYRINHAPFNLFDISLVTRPADPVAWALEKAASEYNTFDYSDTVRVMDEDTYKLESFVKEAVDKVADIIKKVDTPVIDKATKLDDNIMKLKKLGTPIKFPSKSYTQLKAMNLNPAVVLTAALTDKVCLSLDEIAYYIGKLVLKKMFNKRMHDLLRNNLSTAIHLAKADPIHSLKFITHIIDNFPMYDNDKDSLTGLQEHIEDSRDKLLIIKEGGLNDKNDFYKHPNNYYTNLTYKELLSEAPSTIVEVINKHNPNIMFKTTVRDIKDNLILDKPLLTDITQPIAKTAGALSMLGGFVSLFNSKQEAQILGIPAMIIGSILLSKAEPTSERVNINNLQQIEKHAAATSVVNELNKIPKLPLVGVGIPTLLAGDYLYNKNRINNNPNIYAEMTPTQRQLFNLGNNVYNNPLLSIGVGLGGAGLAKGVGLGLLNRLKAKK